MREVVSKRLAWLTFVFVLPSAACGGSDSSNEPAAVSGMAGVGPQAGRASGVSGRAAMFAAISAGARADAGAGAGASTRTAREVSAGAAGAERAAAGAGGAAMSGQAGDPAAAEPIAGSAAEMLGGGAGKLGSQLGTGGRKAPAGGAGGVPAAAASGGAGAGGAPQAGEAGQGGMPSPPPDIDPGALLGSSGLHAREILGYYVGDWGELALSLHGNQIWASYARADGTVVASLREDGVLTGWWSETPGRSAPNTAGEIELRFTRNGDAIALSGRLRAGTQGDWQDAIDLLLVNGQDAPAALTSRFDDAAAFRPHP